VINNNLQILQTRFKEQGIKMCKRIFNNGTSHKGDILISDARTIGKTLIFYEEPAYFQDNSYSMG
jgi:hypothetical protein